MVSLKCVTASPCDRHVTVIDDVSTDDAVRPSTALGTDTNTDTSHGLTHNQSISN